MDSSGILHFICQVESYISNCLTKHFVRLDPITRPVNNPINIFLINPNIFLSYVFRLQCRLNTNLFSDYVELIGYFASAFSASTPYVSFLPRINISFSLLSSCTDELISAPIIMIFFPQLPSVNKNFERELNPTPQPIYLYLSRQHSQQLALQIQISSYLMYKLCLSFLIEYLVCKKYIDLLLF